MVVRAASRVEKMHDTAVGMGWNVTEQEAELDEWVTWQERQFPIPNRTDTMSIKL